MLEMISTMIVTTYGSIFSSGFVAMVTLIQSKCVMKLEQENRMPNTVEPMIVTGGRHRAKMTSAMLSQPNASMLRYAS